MISQSLKAKLLALLLSLIPFTLLALIFLANSKGYEQVFGMYGAFCMGVVTGNSFLWTYENVWVVLLENRRPKPTELESDLSASLDLMLDLFIKRDTDLEINDRDKYKIISCGSYWLSWYSKHPNCIMLHVDNMDGKRATFTKDKVWSIEKERGMTDDEVRLIIKHMKTV